MLAGILFQTYNDQYITINFIIDEGAPFFASLLPSAVDVLAAENIFKRRLDSQNFGIPNWLQEGRRMLIFDTTEISRKTIMRIQ